MTYLCSAPAASPTGFPCLDNHFELGHTAASVFASESAFALAPGSGSGSGSRFLSQIPVPCDANAAHCILGQRPPAQAWPRPIPLGKQEPYWGIYLVSGRGWSTRGSVV